MDRLDISIIRELSQSQTMLPAKVGLRSSYRSMAKKLRVSPGTIRNRLQSLYGSGFLSGSSVYFNPGILGFKAGAYAVEIPTNLSKRDAIEKLKMTDGVIIIHNFHSALVGIFFIFKESDLQIKLQQFRAATGAKEGLYSEVPYPQCTAHLREAEWTLIDRLSKGPFESHNQLARDLGMKVRTLKNQMSKIMRAQAVLSMPTLNYRAIERGIPSDLIVIFSDPATRNITEQKVSELLNSYLLFVGISEEYNVYNLVLPNFPMVADLEADIRMVEGVKMVRAELVEEHIDLIKKLVKYIPK
jgi:DNA-binding Lrp family transcriptional regulator